MKRTIEIYVPGQNPLRHELADERTTVGSGVQQTVRLSAQSGLPACALELSLPEGGENGVLVEVPEVVAGGVVYDGVEHRRVMVPWGDEVFFGPVRFTFLEEQGEGRAWRRVGLAALGLLLLGTLGTAFLGSLAPREASARDLEPPLLVEPRDLCPSEEAPLHRAQVAEAAARAKEERYFFSRRDGVQALALYQEARACYEAAGGKQEALQMSGELERWSSVVEEEYAALRLRQRLALDKGRPAEALAATRALQTLLGPAGPAPDPYRSWLEAVRRELERKVARGKK